SSFTCANAPFTAACRASTISCRCSSRAWLFADGLMVGPSHVLATGGGIGHRQPHGLDEGPDLPHVLIARLGVGAALDAPVPAPLGTAGRARAEHVEAARVPEVERPLDPRPGLTAAGRELGRLVLAVVDVALLLDDDVGQDPVEGRIGP